MGSYIGRPSTSKKKKEKKKKRTDEEEEIVRTNTHSLPPEAMI